MYAKYTVVCAEKGSMDSGPQLWSCGLYSLYVLPCGLSNSWDLIADDSRTSLLFGGCIGEGEGSTEGDTYAVDSNTVEVLHQGRRMVDCQSQRGLH